MVFFPAPGTAQGQGKLERRGEKYTAIRTSDGAKLALSSVYFMTASTKGDY